MGNKQRFGIVALGFGVLLALAAQEGGHRPYREKLPDGEVDWYDGWIRVTATAPLDASAPKGKAQVDARRVAMVKAQAAALRIALRVPVDSERRLESFQALQVKVKGVVSGAQVLEDKVGAKEVSITLEVPVDGVRGLRSEVAAVVIPPEEPPPPPPPAQKPKPAAGPKAQGGAPEAAPGPEAASTTSVTVEAAEAGVQPALFPRIVDTEGREVYSAKTIGRVGASQKAIARYVSTPPGGGPAAMLPGGGGAGLPLAFIGAGPSFFLLQGPPPRKRGGETLVVKASSAAGSLRSDIVVTEEAAKKLREAEGSSKVLSQARVVVVVRSDVGGVEGRRRSIDAAVELARR